MARRRSKGRKGRKGGRKASIVTQMHNPFGRGMKGRGGKSRR